MRVKKSTWSHLSCPAHLWLCLWWPWRELWIYPGLVPALRLGPKTWRRIGETCSLSSGRLCFENEGLTQGPVACWWPQDTVQHLGRSACWPHSESWTTSMCWWDMLDGKPVWWWPRRTHLRVVWSSLPHTGSWGLLPFYAEWDQESSSTLTSRRNDPTPWYFLSPLQLPNSMPNRCQRDQFCPWTHNKSSLPPKLSRLNPFAFILIFLKNQYASVRGYYWKAEEGTWSPADLSVNPAGDSLSSIQILQEK